MSEGKQTQHSLDMSGQKTCVVKRPVLFANQPPQSASETKNKYKNREQNNIKSIWTTHFNQTYFYFTEPSLKWWQLTPNKSQDVTSSAVSKGGSDMSSKIGTSLVMLSIWFTKTLVTWCFQTPFCWNILAHEIGSFPHFLGVSTYHNW